MRSSVKEMTEFRDIYLTSGRLLVYNKSTGKAEISSIISAAAYLPAEPQETITTGKGNVASGTFMFSNQSLSDVLDQLQKIYDQKIIYDKADIQNLSFIGKIDKTDALEDVLKSIALLNKLQLSKQSNGVFRIYK